MKKLLLIRHAKATHETGFADFERPLKPSGLHDAAVMAGRVKESGVVPQALVSSPALRTLSTANIFSQHLDLPPAEEISGVYEAGEEELIDIINELNDDHDFVGLVGHNPGIAQVLYHFSGEIKDVPPGGVALIEFDAATWSDLSGKSGKLTFYDIP
jgi:phosphohistidine phosphatase